MLRQETRYKCISGVFVFILKNYIRILMRLIMIVSMWHLSLDNVSRGNTWCWWGIWKRGSLIHISFEPGIQSIAWPTFRIGDSTFNCCAHFVVYSMNLRTYFEVHVFYLFWHVSLFEYEDIYVNISRSLPLEDWVQLVAVFSWLRRIKSLAQCRIEFVKRSNVQGLNRIVANDVDGANLEMGEPVPVWLSTDCHSEQTAFDPTIFNSQPAASIS